MPFECAGCNGVEFWPEHIPKRGLLSSLTNGALCWL